MEKKFRLKLLKLHCYANEEQGHDDVFLMFNGKKVWPEKKRQKGVRIGIEELGVTVEGLPEKQPLTIELWDHDYISAHDHYGDFVFEIQGTGGPFTTDMRKKSDVELAKFTLEWAVEMGS